MPALGEKKRTDPRIFVTVRVAEGMVFRGQLMAMSAINDRGLFDVLPEHINFITIIKEKLTLHINNDISKEIKFDQGLMRVFENKVSIYLGLEKVILQ